MVLLFSIGDESKEGERHKKAKDRREKTEWKDSTNREQ